MELAKAQYQDWDRLPVVLSTEQVCILLDCCKLTVHKQIEAGVFKAGKLGKAWRIDRDSIRAFVMGETGGTAKEVNAS